MGLRELTEIQKRHGVILRRLDGISRAFKRGSSTRLLVVARATQMCIDGPLRVNDLLTSMKRHSYQTDWLGSCCM